METDVEANKETATATATEAPVVPAVEPLPYEIITELWTVLEKLKTPEMKAQALAEVIIALPWAGSSKGVCFWYDLWVETKKGKI
jgi:hypothetical protein